MDNDKNIIEKNEDRKKSIIAVVSIVVIVCLLVLVAVTVYEMLNLVLLTFLLTFIFYHLLNMVKRRLGTTVTQFLPDGLILFLIYIVVIGLIAIISTRFAPTLIEQITAIAKIFIDFDANSVRDALDPRISEFLWEFELEGYISEAGVKMIEAITDVGAFAINIVFALLLSFMILLEKDMIRRFGSTLEDSKIGFLYDYFIYFGSSFVTTFGHVMKVQVTISFINCIISMIGLTILGFPQILGLGIMIFVFGLIPVAGVIISLIPLSIIGFNVGGFKMVFAVLLMVAIIHAIEAYILNPKLMSNRTALPVCFVFIILLVAEHFLGVWGLLIGVPLFVFLMKVFDVNYKEACKPRPVFNKERLESLKKKMSSSKKDNQT